MSNPRNTPRRRWWPGTALPVLLIVATLLAVAPCLAAEPNAVEAGWILQRLARPAPSRTPFVELRGSALLKTPLRIQGEYRRPRKGALIRQVRAPYVETSTIADGQVRIERAGHAPRTFSLSRAPALAGLQAGFGALLAGDSTRLNEQFRIAAAGTRRHWTLTLTPRDTTLAEKLRALVLYGRGSELRCIETRPTDEPAQRTLLAGAAAAAGAGLDADRVQALCRGTGSRD